MTLKNLVVSGASLLILVFSCHNTGDQSSTQNEVKLVRCIDDGLSPKQEKIVRTQLGADKKTQQLDTLFKRRAKFGFNGTVLIAQRGVVLYKNSFGYSDIRAKDTLHIDSKFQLASLSKTFTAIATLKLVESGKLSLDDSVQRFFPDFPYKNIYIRSLLSHRSGLPNYAYVLVDSVRKRNPYPNNADIMRWLAIVKPKPYNYPNRNFGYCNTNYSVLASIIEKVSGMTFEAYLQKTIFDPLGMKNTYLVTTKNDSIHLNQTVGHQYGHKLSKDNYDDIVGDKGVYSTAEDLYRWYKGINSDCILRADLRKEAFTPRSFERGGIKNYGYGFRMHVADSTRTAKYIYHTGWWKGYNTLMWFNPKDEFVIIILSNKYDRSIYQIKPLLEILHGKEQNGDVEKDMF